MRHHKLQVKVFARPSADAVELDTLIPVFHSWISRELLPELLIDVANYAHVPRGPGIALIGHGSDYFFEEADGERGLLHSRKRLGPEPENRLQDAVARAVHAAFLLEREPALRGKLSFQADRLLVRINDRLSGADKTASVAELSRELESLAAKLWPGARPTITTVGEARALPSVLLTVDAATDLETLIGRLGGPPGPDGTKPVRS